MSIYDQYQIVINEAQRRLIMPALTNAMANDRRSTAGGALTRPTEDEWMQLIRLLSTIKPSMQKRLTKVLARPYPTRYSHCAVAISEQTRLNNIICDRIANGPSPWPPEPSK
jgi:hypothetical protein